MRGRWDGLGQEEEEEHSPEKKKRKISLKGECWVEPGFHRGSFGGMEALGDLVGLVAWD